MTSGDSQTAERFTMLCRRCDRPLLARVEWIGREVYCPHCQSLLRVPARPAGDRPAIAEAPDLAARNGFNFACPQCDCLLEAHTGMSGHRGTCPTCGARFAVPFVSPRSGRPDKAVLIEGEAEAPMPVHAYGASGHQAPQIITYDDGTTVIQCPRCNAHSPIDADVCDACGAPFTMEAAATVGKLYRDRRATASVTFGVISLFLFFAIIPALIAAWLGLRSVLFPGSSRRTVVGFVGLFLGLLSLIGGIIFWYFKLQ